MDKFNMIHH